MKCFEMGFLTSIHLLELTMNTKAHNTLLSAALLSTLLLVSVPSYAERIGGGPYEDNCVKYLRYVRGVNFPNGVDLTKWDAKLSIRNKGTPKKGRVAIIDVTSGKYKENGHVALVTDVDDKGKKKSITIEEANNPSPGYWRRRVEGSKLSDIENKLNIRGYYKP